MARVHSPTVLPQTSRKPSRQPQPQISAPRTAPLPLALLRFLVAQSRHLAARVLDGSAADDDRARIRRAYEFAHRREPTPSELERATALLREAATDLRSANAPDQTPTAVWALFCQELLVSNEFRFVD